MNQADTSEHVDEALLGEVLMLLDDEDPDGLLRACDLFRSGVPERMREIDAAVHDGRFDDAARASHSLRGSAGAFGARRLSNLGERLESLCLQSDAEAGAALLNEMGEEFRLFRDILDARLAEVTERRAREV